MSWTSSFIARPRGQSTLAFLAYAAFAIAITWPFAVQPGTTLYGIQGADLTSSVSKYQELADAMQLPFLAGTAPDINAPVGLPTTWALDLASLPSSLALWILSVAFGAVTAHGLFALAGFTLSALAMFLFVRRITGHPGAALIAGLAFGFWPYAYEYGWTSIQYMHGWVLVLVLWRMHELLEKPSTANGLLAGASAVLAMTWTPYFLLIAGVAYAALAVCGLAIAASRGAFVPQLRGQVVATVTVALFLGALGAITSTADFEGVRANDPRDAIAFSARPFMYLVPGPTHPVLGEVTKPWVHSRYGDPNLAPTKTAAYSNVYLGMFVMLAGVLALLLLLKQALTRAHNPTSGRLPVAVGGMAATAFVTGLVFSAPPEARLFGIDLPLPYHFINEVTTTFRVASRFAVVAMLGLCVLAGLAIAAILRRRPFNVQAVVIAALAIAVPLDLWARPDPGTSQVDVPPVYGELLADQPPGIVAEYPLVAARNAASLTTFLQQYHGHRLFNGWADDSEDESRKMELQDLTASRTAPLLARHGVRYVVARHFPPGTAGLPPRYPSPGASIRGLRKIGSDAYGTLYRVVAQPARYAVAAISGFHLPELDQRVRWVREQRAQIEVVAPCARCRGTLSFASGTFAQPRRLEIRDERGRSVYSDTVGSSAQRLRVPLRFSRRTVLTLTTTPPPQSVDATLHNGDMRRLGIFVGAPIRFSEDGRR